MWADDAFRWMGFLGENKNNFGWNGACGRMTLFIFGFFLAKRNIILDGARHVDGALFSLHETFLAKRQIILERSIRTDDSFR